MCKQTETISTLECQNLIEPLTVRYHDIVREYSSLSHLVENRIKRGAWIGGIGTLFKQVFGTLDEDDALRYDSAIESVQNDGRKLASLVKQNILISVSTISSFNKTIHKIKTNEDKLSYVLDNLSKNLSNVTIITNDLLYKSHLNSVLNMLESTIITLSFQLEDIVNAITLSSQNILHPSIISPEQLFRELADNYRHLPSNLELPISLDLSLIHTILNICSVSCYYLNNRIVFVLKIPLVLPKEFNLYHSVALPTPYKLDNPDTFSMITPSNKYIAITKDKTYYCNIQSLQECKQTTPQNYMCDVTNEYQTSAKLSCESELISRSISEVPNQCETRFVYGSVDIWKPLVNNRWIYVQSKLSKLSIDCVDSEIFETNVIGTGILNLPSHCIAYCKSSRLIPKRNSFNTTLPVTNYNFSLINDSCCSISKLDKIKSNVSPITLENIDLDDLREKKEILQSFIAQTEEIQNSPHIIKYGTHYSITTLFLSIIIIVFIFYKLYRLLKTGGNLKTLKIINNTNEAQNSVHIPENNIEEDQISSAPRIRSHI